MNDTNNKKFLGTIIVLMIFLLLGLCTLLVTGVRRIGRENSISSFKQFLDTRKAHTTLSTTTQQ